MPHIDFIGPDGKAWPSATELTGLLPKAWLWNWYKSSVKKRGFAGWEANEAKSNIGKTLGTAVHDILDKRASKKLVEAADPEAEKIADALWAHMLPLIDEWVMGDVHLMSEKHKLHGSTDGIVRLAGEIGLWVLDWKTSNAIDPGHPLQLCIYALCWNETHPDQKIDQGIIVRVNKDSGRLPVKVDEYKGLLQYEPVVMALRTIYQHMEDSK